MTDEQVDVGFFAIDPVRGAGLQFTAPYVFIEGAYLVRDDSPIKRNDQVDQPGVRVVVGLGSAYDLYLSRELKNAQILRAPTSPSVVDVFLAQGLDMPKSRSPEAAQYLAQFVERQKASGFGGADIFLDRLCRH